MYILIVTYKNLNLDVKMNTSYHSTYGDAHDRVLDNWFCNGVARDDDGELVCRIVSIVILDNG